MTNIASFEELLERQLAIGDDPEGAWDLTAEYEATDLTDFKDLALTAVAEGRLIRNLLVAASIEVDSSVRHRKSETGPPTDRRKTRDVPVWAALTLPDHVNQTGRTRVFLSTVGTTWCALPPERKVSKRQLDLASQGHALLTASGNLGPSIREDFPDISPVRILYVARIAHINAALRNGMPL